LFDRPSADGVSGAYQVGSARSAANSYDHATLWMGTAASAFDLHPFVVAADPSFLSSYALAISDDGTIIGYATTATTNYAVLWTPVPEPASVWLTAAAFSGILFSRIRRSEALSAIQKLIGL